MNRPEEINESELAAFRLPKKMRREARIKCAQEDINFSQLMRRAIRRELGLELQEPKKAVAQE